MLRQDPHGPVSVQAAGLLLSPVLEGSIQEQRALPTGCATSWEQTPEATPRPAMAQSRLSLYHLSPQLPRASISRLAPASMATNTTTTQCPSSGVHGGLPCPKCCAWHQGRENQHGPWPQGASGHRCKNWFRTERARGSTDATPRRVRAGRSCLVRGENGAKPWLRGRLSEQ